MVLRKLADLVGILWQFGLSVQDSGLAKRNEILRKVGLDFTEMLCHLCATADYIDKINAEKSRTWRPWRFYDLKGGYIEDDSPNPYEIQVNMKTPKPTRVFKELTNLFNRLGVNERDYSVLKKSEKKFRELLTLRQQCEAARRIFDDDDFAETPAIKKAVEKETEYPSVSFDDRKYDLKRLDWNEESRKFKRHFNLKKYGVRKPSYKDHGRKSGLRAKEALAAWN